jgi:transcriptional regulator with XRE-family HTH domain
VNFFGKRIKDERLKNNMTVQELSIRTNIDETTINNIEEGNLFPNINHLTEISKVFDKHIGYFLRDVFVK